MGFRFPLATLLRLREIAEQREERLLGQILNQMAQSRQALAELQTQRQNLRVQRELALQHATSAFQILGFDEQMRLLEDLEITGRENLAKLTALREQQMKIYEAAHRERELLSSMRVNRIEAFQKECERQDQKAMDDIYSSRRRLP